MTVSQTKFAIRRAERSALNMRKGPFLHVCERIEIDEWEVDVLGMLFQEPDPKRHEPDEPTSYVFQTMMDVETRAIAYFRLRPLDD